MDQNEKMEFLANSIKKAQRVMERVEDKPISSRTTTRRPLTEDDVDSMLQPEMDFISEDRVPQYQQQPYAPPAPQMRNMSKSKLPAEILKSFQEMPPIDPTQPVGMELLMNKIAESSAPVRQATAAPIREQRQPQQIVKEIIKETAPQMDTKLIEYIIRKTVEETLEQVSKKTALSENIQIKIGDKTFSGKITSLNEIKKTTIKK